MSDSTSAAPAVAGGFRCTGCGAILESAGSFIVHQTCQEAQRDAAPADAGGAFSEAQWIRALDAVHCDCDNECEHRMLLDALAAARDHVRAAYMQGFAFHSQNHDGASPTCPACRQFQQVLDRLPGGDVVE